MIEVLRGGLCDLVVDPGRPGWGALGVPAAGAADPAALMAANRLAGNSSEAAGLEISLSGPILRFPFGAVVALTGAHFAATRSSGVAVAWNETLAMAAGETLSLDRARDGCRCWLAVQGGLAVPRVMGSRSTFLPAGFGGYLGRTLKAGDALPCDLPAGKVGRLQASPPFSDRASPLRVIAGPQAGLFGDTGLAAFFAGTYRVDASSDRRGLRLAGPVVAHARVDLPSQGVLPGAIQIPPDGQPIILGWDGPVTGGYPVIAGVISADLPKLAQLCPGDAVRFVTIEIAAAREAVLEPWKVEVLE